MYVQQIFTPKPIKMPRYVRETAMLKAEFTCMGIPEMLPKGIRVNKHVPWARPPPYASTTPSYYVDMVAVLRCTGNGHAVNVHQTSL